MNKKLSAMVQHTCLGPEKKQLYLTLPYCGNSSTKLHRQLVRILSKIAPWAKLNVIFKPCFRLSTLSNLKSGIPLQHRSNVVYKINCSQCEDFYIGMTQRRVYKRLHEHKTRHYCAVYKHISDLGHDTDFDNHQILASDCNKIRFLIKETLCIKSHSANTSLNVNVKSFECKLF